MKLKIKTNFDFNLLKKYVEKDVDKELYKKLGSHLARKSKLFIQQGLVKPELTDRRIREKQVSGSPTPEIPLMDTGYLVKSIKGTEKGVEAVDYAFKHVHGLDKRPERDFISQALEVDEVSGKKFSTILKRIIKKMRNVMKKSRFS